MYCKNEVNNITDQFLNSAGEIYTLCTQQYGWQQQNHAKKKKFTHD